MGRGDPRTRRGKIFRGSYGNTRPKAKNKKFTPPSTAPTTAPTDSLPIQQPVEEESPVVEA